MHPALVCLVLLLSASDAPREPRSEGALPDRAVAGTPSAGQVPDLSGVMPATSAPSATTHALAVADPAGDGFGLRSADGAHALFIHGLFRMDFRDFIGDSPTPDRSTFSVSSAALRLNAQVFERFRGQLFFDFAGSRTTLLDAWLEVALTPEIALRAGKFQAPLSEERLAPSTQLAFTGPAITSFLLPSRDIGVQLLGSVWGGRLAFNLALTDGAVAGTLIESDADSGKDVLARVLVRPFRGTDSPASELGLGLGASTGTHRGRVDAPELFVLRSYGNQQFFAFRNDRSAAGTALAAGEVQRLVPHALWAWRSLAAYGEAVWSREEISGRVVTSHAWGVIGRFVLFGADARPLTILVPRRPFRLATGDVGALEIVAGIGAVQVGAGAFPSLADARTSQRGMHVYGLGMNWFPLPGVGLLVSHAYQTFDAAPGGAARPNEQTLIARLQLSL